MGDRDGDRDYVKISLLGGRGLHARFRAVEKAPAGMLRDLAIRAVAEQKRGAPVKTGNLRRTIHLGSVTTRSATTVASAKYAPAVEFGTRPHIIRPRRAKVLRFAAGGRVVFTKLVRHPGTKPQPFMIPGARKALEMVGVRAIVDAWNGAD
jgi:hypothetical protein